MADTDMPPIQVFLDTKRFIERPAPPPVVPGTKDFFQGNNRGFVEHKTRLKSRVEVLANSLRRVINPVASLKSGSARKRWQRAIGLWGACLRPQITSRLWGQTRVGELLFQVTPRALDGLANIIETKAEETPRLVLNRKTGKEEPRVLSLSKRAWRNGETSGSTRRPTKSHFLLKRRCAGCIKKM